MTIEKIAKIDDDNIKIASEIDYEETYPDINLTCLICKKSYNTKFIHSFEGHNCICDNCCTDLSENKHLALSKWLFITKFINTQKNIWTTIPIDYFNTKD